MIRVQCGCGRKLRCGDEFAGTRAECPFCGEVVAVPSKSTPVPQPAAAPAPGIDLLESVEQSYTGRLASATQRTLPREREEAVEIVEFFDPPAPAATPPAPEVPQRPWIEIVLDPNNIQWLLIFGGGVCVLGLVVLLTSMGVFKDPWIQAGALMGGTAVVMGTGWYLALKTRYKVAGQALTFLACVVAPLNLWFLHAQNLVPLQNHLWVGGVVCCLLYVATVSLLRQPAFVYAVEAGITLTTLLFLYSLGLAVDASHLCLGLISLGLISIHVERAFAPGGGEFSRERYGLPVFFAGQVQLLAGLAILLGTQSLDVWVRSVPVPGKPPLLAYDGVLTGVIWLIGAYAYAYSDLVVRRIGVYTYFAAFCLLMGGATLCSGLELEIVMMALAALSMLANIESKRWVHNRPDIMRLAFPIGVVLCAAPLLIGISLHVRATSLVAQELHWQHTTNALFVAAMLFVALSARVSAFLFRDEPGDWGSCYFFISAGGVMIAAAGALRISGVPLWTQQAPILMLIPIAYMLAARLWRGRRPEWPLGWVAHIATGFVLLGVLGAWSEIVFRQPALAHRTALLLNAATFAEAAVFYALAAWIRRRSINVHFGSAAACLALWQLFQAYELPDSLYMMAYALVGTALLFLSHAVGLAWTNVFRRDGEMQRALRGPGLEIHRAGHAVLSVSQLAAILQGLTWLLGSQNDALRLTALVVTAVAGGVGSVLSLPSGWRRSHALGAVGVLGVAVLLLLINIPLKPWEKAEIVIVGLGVITLIAACIGRLREKPAEEDLVVFGMWMGSVMASLPLVVAVVSYRWAMQASLWDELGLITVSTALLLSGVMLRAKGTTVIGGLSFGIYAIILLVSLGWSQQLAPGVYLAIGGGAIFLMGILLSVFRERLITMPDRIARREGVFQLFSWK